MEQKPHTIPAGALTKASPDFAYGQDASRGTLGIVGLRQLDADRVARSHSHRAGPDHSPNVVRPSRRSVHRLLPRFPQPGLVRDGGGGMFGVPLFAGAAAGSPAPIRTDPRSLRGIVVAPFVVGSLIGRRREFAWTPSVFSAAFSVILRSAHPSRTLLHP